MGVPLCHISCPPQVLPCLLRPFSHVLYHLPLGTVTSLVQQLTNLPQKGGATAPPNPHLTAVLQNKVLTPPKLRVCPPLVILLPQKNIWRGGRKAPCHLGVTVVTCDSPGETF